VSWIRHLKGQKESWADKLLYSGFVDCAEAEGDGIMYETSARKPHWDSGAAVPLSLKKKQAAPPAQAAPTPKVRSHCAGDGVVPISTG
jgi:hypothetical protein